MKVREEGKPGKWSVKERKRQETKAENEYKYNDIHILFIAGIKARAAGSGHVSYLLCPDPRCTHYLDENVVLLLQVTERQT